MKFEELDLSPKLLEGIKLKGFESCTPIQAEVMPLALAGKDISGLSQTGTGKTAAFLLPLMERICRSQEKPESEELAKRAFKDWKNGQYILILVPTRELAEQVHADVESLRGETGLRAVSIFGGTGYDKQKARLKEGVEFVVGTPGRLIDLYKSHSLDLRQVRAVVFDEADRMFDMGFKDDMQYLLQRIPKQRQMLLFSATLNFDVTTTAYRFGAEPVELNLSKDEVKAENVDDKIMHCGSSEKPQFLFSLLKREDAKQIIVFSNFKSMVSRISRFLTDNGFPAVGISSLLTQKQRQRVMSQFKGESEHNILVATDVAARGLDIKGVDLVINYDLPDDPENYVHRIGRTGRAGKTGKAISLVGENDVEALMRVEEFLDYKLEADWLEDNQIIEDFKKLPARDDRPDRRHAPRGKGPRQRNDRRNKSDSSETQQSSKPKQRQARRSEPKDNKPKDNKEMHRDRRIGRHGQQKTERASASQQSSQPKRATRPKKTAGKATKKAAPRRKSDRKVVRSSRRSSQSRGLSEKVSGFFKKLFS